MASQRRHPPCTQARRRRRSPLGPSGVRAARCRQRTGASSGVPPGAVDWGGGRGAAPAAASACARACSLLLDLLLVGLGPLPRLGGCAKAKGRPSVLHCVGTPCPRMVNFRPMCGFHGTS
eukprot:4467515-Pyramimonas_sp.AAC.1